MTTIEQKTMDMYKLLPEQEQILAYELIKRMVLAWDSDFTKLTSDERKRLELADKEKENGEWTDYSQIEW